MDSGTRSILDLDSMHYMTTISLEMSDEPYLYGLFTRETHANIHALRFIEETMGQEKMQESAYELTKFRQTQFEDKVKYIGPLYISELLQIRNLVPFVSKENKNQIIEKLNKKIKKEWSLFPEEYKNFLKKTKLTGLLQIYSNPNLNLDSSFNLIIKPVSFIFFVLLIINYILLWEQIKRFNLFYELDLSFWMILLFIIAFIILTRLIKTLNLKLWNRKIALINGLLSNQ